MRFDVFGTLRGFVFTSCVVRWRGMTVSGVVVGESTSALGDGRVCLIRVTCMHCIKSMRLLEDECVCLRMNLNMLLWCKEVQSYFEECLLWVGGVVYYFEECLPSLGCLSILIRVLSSVFFSCDSVLCCFHLQRRPESVGRRDSYHYGK